MPDTFAAVVVTYNRKELLVRCLQALTGQTRRPDAIIIVDNASSDGTADLLRSEGWSGREDVTYVRLEENTGGAGGFATGIAYTGDLGFNWAWIMDDDAEPHHDALERLVDAKPQAEHVYGSMAVYGNHVSWPMTPYHGSWRNEILQADAAPPLTDVNFLPFLGLLVHRELVASIGLPDTGFFLAADDVEYCLRARKHGARIILVGPSRIEHPPSQRYAIRLLWLRLHTLRLPPWKRYYDVRNRLFVARRHHGFAFYYSTIPGSFLRLIATLIREPERLLQLRAFTAGMLDGLRGRKGKRHDLWGL